MIALVDCNSFFCSVEKVFHPGLNGKPVCVLSCNDGCIVALTPEVKALGLHRGDPIFKKKDIVLHYEVKLFSTNMMLYAAMSKRVNNILRASVPRSEVYSIDESFLYLDGLEKYLIGNGFFLQYQTEALFLEGAGVENLVSTACTCGKRNQQIWFFQCTDFTDCVCPCSGNDDVSQCKKVSKLIFDIFVLNITFGIG